MIVYEKDKASAYLGDRVYESIQEAEKEIQLLERQSLVKIITLEDYIFEYGSNQYNEGYSMGEY